MKLFNLKSFPPPRVGLALVTVQFLFGVSYIVSKYVVDAMPPLIWAHLRSFFAGLLMLAFAGLSGKKRPPMNAEFWKGILILAPIGVVLNQGCFLLGLRYTSSINSAVINTSIPVFTLFLVVILRQEKLTARKTLGFLGALIGVLIILKIESFRLGAGTWRGDALTLVNCSAYASFLVFGKRFLERFDPFWSSAVLFLVGSLGLLLWALPDYRVWQGIVWSIPMAWALTFALVGATFATYLLNFWALTKTSSSIVSVFVYLQPLFTAIIGFIAFGETPSVRALLGGVFIFGGMMVATSK